MLVLRNTDSLHNYALVINLWMDDQEVNQVLVDLRASTEILFKHIIRRLGFPMEGLISEQTVAVRLGGKRQITIGSLKLIVSTPPHYLRTRFRVVDTPSSYNPIIGQG